MYSYRLEESLPASCGFCHIPYDELNMPFPAHLTYCYNCRKQKVPDVLFTTIDLPAEAAVIGKGCLIQARCVGENSTWGPWKSMGYGAKQPYFKDVLCFLSGILDGLGSSIWTLYFSVWKIRRKTPSLENSSKLY